MDPQRIDRQVRLILEWLAEDAPTAGEMVLVLARALTIWIECLPLEERPRRLQELWRSLDDTMDAIEDMYAEVVIEAPPAIRH